MKTAGSRLSAGSGVRPIRFLVLICLGGWSVAACTRGTVPIVSGGALLPSTLTAAAAVTRTPIYLFTPGPGYQFPHAVFGVSEGSFLTIHQAAGVAGGDLGELAFDHRGLALTGKATNLGSSTWVEIVRPEGGTGWVSSANLTQDVPGAAFCADPRVPPLVEALRAALAARDGSALPSVVDPRRGLTLRYDWWNTEVVFAPHQLNGLFSSDESRDWGTFLSGTPIQGPFKAVALPSLEDVTGDDVATACNETLTGPVVREARWPTEYTNLNYIALFRPARRIGGEYSWSSWLVGIEYLDNQPYISHLVQLRAGI